MIATCIMVPYFFLFSDKIEAGVCSEDYLHILSIVMVELEVIEFVCWLDPFANASGALMCNVSV